MDCREWENQLADLLEGRLTAKQREQAQEHLAGCPACRDLLAAVRRNRAVLSETEGRDLTAAILAATTGSACGRAEELLGDLPGGGLAGLDEKLLRAHLEHCAQCSALAETLTWQDAVLREMAELDPGPEFTGAVLAATSRIRRRLRTRELGWFQRLGTWWRGQLARPRFTLEAAYVGTMLLIALCGTPISPLKEAPPQALEMVKAGPDLVGSALGSQWRIISAEVAGTGGWIWDRTGGKVGAAAAGLGEEIQRRRRRTEPAVAQLGRHAGELGDALLDLDLVAASLRLDQIGPDLKEIWRCWREETPSRPPAGLEPDRSGSSTTDPAESAP